MQLLKTSIFKYETIFQSFPIQCYFPGGWISLLLIAWIAKPNLRGFATIVLCSFNPNIQVQRHTTRNDTNGDTTKQVVGRYHLHNPIYNKLCTQKNMLMSLGLCLIFKK